MTTSVVAATLLGDGNSDTGGPGIGNFFLGSIHGVKFDDGNNNGTRDFGERGVPFVRVYLDSNLDGSFQSTEPSMFTTADDLSSTTVDEGGEYWFLNLGPGAYQVREVVPAGATQTSFAPLITLQSGQVWVGHTGQSRLTENQVEVVASRLQLGNHYKGGNGAIHGCKFNDLNGNGIEDAGEPEAPGVTFQLSMLGGDGLFHVIATTTTSVTGSFAFDDLLPGTYQLTEIAPGSITTTPPISGNIVVGAGETISFGDCPQPAEICGQKYNDLNGNGRQDPNENGINGVTIQIFDDPGLGRDDLLATVVTMNIDENMDGVIDPHTESGLYCFTNLAPGTYFISELAPAGTVQTFPVGNGGYAVTVGPGEHASGDKKPVFVGMPNNAFLGQVAVTTNFEFTASNPVVGIVDLAPVMNVNANSTPPIYHGPAGNLWTRAKLGNIFGVTLDDDGNIYVTATSAYSTDIYGPGGSGAVYKIANGTGLITTWAVLPTTTGSPSPASLGNITYDLATHSFYVSNLDDGRIYHRKSDGTSAGSWDHGANLSPPVADDPLQSFSQLGRRIWGVQTYQGRLYYGVWQEDSGSVSTTKANQVWSVGLNATGNFVGSAQLEFSMPVFSGSYSNPISDISFGPGGTMLVAERSMYSATNTGAHTSRVLEYMPSSAGWVPLPTNKFRVGKFSVQANAAGGVDYDYSSGGRVWATGDALLLGNVPPPSVGVYGLQGLPSTGGTFANSFEIDLNGVLSSGDKTQVGDVELPRPAFDFGNYGGTTTGPKLDVLVDFKLTDIFGNTDDNMNVGTGIREIVGTSITDRDAEDPQGIAVIEVNNAEGVWQYSTNGGAMWTAFPSASPLSAGVSPMSAVVLGTGDNDRLRFLPRMGFEGTVNPGLMFRAWDQSDGRESGTTGVNASLGGGRTAFSAEIGTMTVSVLRANVAPVLARIGNKSGNELVALTFMASATDADLPANTLTFSLSGAPEGATINASSGVFAWTPTELDGPRSYTFDVQVSDGLLSDSEEITLLINEVNVGPVITSAANINAPENSTAVMEVAVTDPDNSDPLTFSLSGPDADLFEIDASTGVLTFLSAPNFENPTDANDNGVYELTVSVIDGGGLMDSQSFFVTVTDIFELPPEVLVSLSSGILSITDIAAGGSANHLTLTFDAGDIVISSTTAVLQFEASDGLSVVRITQSSLAASDGPILADLGSLDDFFDASLLGIRVSVMGGTGNDSLIGSSLADALDGGDGNDLLTGLAGSDNIAGGIGTDMLSESADRDMTLTPTSFMVSSINAGQGPTTDVLSGLEAASLTGGASANRIDASTFVPGAGLGVLLSGAAGNDVLTGGSGRDTILGDEGDDSINGGSGNDSITAGDGNDSVLGVAGADRISTGAGRDTVNSGTGNDTVDGGSGNDVLNGQDDNDSLIGGEGDDRLVGGAGNDFEDGGLGADNLKGDDGLDSLQGGAGADTLSGGRDNDQLFGGDDADSIDGAFGNDTLNGGAGSDTLRGASGTDDLDGGADSDRITEGYGTEDAMSVVITGVQMVSSLSGTESPRSIELFVINGGIGNDLMDARGASIRVQFRGFGGNDTLLGSAFADLVSGGDGDDVLSGGASNDVIDGGPGTDFFYEKANANVTITGLQVVSTITGTETLLGIERIALVGGDDANTLNAVASSLAVFLLGGKGNDTLIGSNFNDVLIGGSRTATPTTPGGDGIDSLTGGVGADTFDNDAADTRVTDGSDSVIANVFASPFPSWLDLI